MLRFVALLGSCALLLACQSAASSGAPCARASECAEPLVCASGVCREQCADARDCLPTYSCETFRGAGVCVPPAQAVPCVFNADCGALFCRSGHCVAQCTTDHDCERGTCVGSVCTEPVLTPPAPDAGPLVDANTGQCAAHGVVCQTDGLCHDLSSDNHACGQCGVSCPSGGACEAGACVCGGMPCAPSNDACADALLVPLDANGRGAVATDFAGATAQLPPCGILDGAEVFFRVHLDRRSVLEAVAFGAYPDVMDQGCGALPIECGSACDASLDGHFEAAVVGPGDVFIALRVPASIPAALQQLQVHAIPIDDLAVTRMGSGVVHNGDDPVATETLAATALASDCASTDAHGFYWLDCMVPSMDTVTACGTGTTGLVLEHPARGECLPADGTGCAQWQANVHDGLELVIVRGTGGSVRLDVLAN